MTHEELIDIGFELLGEEENDPYYKITFKYSFNFNVYSLSGTLNGNIFHLYNNTNYTDKNKLNKIINIFK